MPALTHPPERPPIVVVAAHSPWTRTASGGYVKQQEKSINNANNFIKSGLLSPASPVNNNNNSGDDDGAGRKTHIEVCVRLRPLHVAEDKSSSSFFENSSSNKVPSSSSPTRSAPGSGSTSRLRKPQVPSHASRLFKPTPRKTSPVRTHTTSDGSNNNNNSTSKLSVANTNNNFYAWDILEEDANNNTIPTTVSQSARTDLVPGRTHQYTLDRVYGQHATTQDLFVNSVQPLVHASMDGYHASVLAYGQTSTGKTHTMSGTPSQPGIVPLAVRECFSYVQQQQQLHEDQQPREFLLRVSYMEVYKEHIRDLLSTSLTAPPVRLFENKKDGLVIRGLVEQVVNSPEQVFAILAQGEKRRQVGATQMNQHSSRSHVIVRLWIESKGISTTTTTLTPSTSAASSLASTTTTVENTNGRASSSSSSGVRISSLSLVDLAGSESIKLTGCTDRREEGHFINKSLMTLGQVVYALSECSGDEKSSNKHVPYRDSKLTRLLQPSLSGNAQVVMICCISPLPTHIEESHNTFKFAIRAKKIPQKATITETGVDEKTLLESYREEIETLKQQLNEARVQQERLLQSKNAGSTTSIAATSNSIMDELLVDEDEISELVKSIQNMEKLILKSKPVSQNQPEELLDTSNTATAEYGGMGDEEEDLMALVEGGGVGDAVPLNSHALRTPSRRRDSSTDRDLQMELSRVKGLLGSVMKKKLSASTSTGSSSTRATTNSHAASSTDAEVRSLRAQLEQQQVKSSLRQADSSFLQKQLEEKDNLLLEVSQVLEALEERQIKLEQENAVLRKELASYIYGN